MARARLRRCRRRFRKGCRICPQSHRPEQLYAVDAGAVGRPHDRLQQRNLQLSLDVVYLPDLRTGSQPLFLHGSHVGRGTVDELWRQGRGARYQLEALCADQRRRLPQALVARSRAVRLLRVQELPSGLQGVLRPQLRGVDQIARLARCHQVPSRTGQLYDLYGG